MITKKKHNIKGIKERKIRKSRTNSMENFKKETEDERFIQIIQLPDHNLHEMRSDLSDERNDLQTAIEFAESSDTSGFYEIPNNAMESKCQLNSLKTLTTEQQTLGSNSRLRRTSRRTQPVC